jgi:hypothetical protein
VLWGCGWVCVGCQRLSEAFAASMRACCSVSSFFSSPPAYLAFKQAMALMLSRSQDGLSPSRYKERMSPLGPNRTHQSHINIDVVHHVGQSTSMFCVYFRSLENNKNPAASALGKGEKKTTVVP